MKAKLKKITIVLMSIGILLTFLTAFFNIPIIKEQVIIPITIALLIVYYKFFYVKVKPNEKFRDPIVKNYPKEEKRDEQTK